MTHWRTITEPDMRAAAPPSPACYAIYLDGRLSYIGQSSNVRRRLEHHQLRRNGGGWSTPWGDFGAVLVKIRESERAGDHAQCEYRLIRRLQPLFNKHGTANRTEQPPRNGNGGDGLPVLKPGFWVALSLKADAAPLRCYVGQIEAVSELGVRLSLIDWFIGTACGLDFFAPWASITSALVATEHHDVASFGEAAARWQSNMGSRDATPGEAGEDGERTSN